MKDALGMDITVGDHVVHISRQGSRVRKTQRVVAQVMENTNYLMFEPDLKTANTAKRFVKPTNVIVLVRPIA